MTTRWGIAATGGMAAAFAEDLAHVPGAEIAFVGSRSPESAADFAGRFGAAGSGTYADLLAAGRAGDVDVVYVATPHPQHRDLALAAIEGGTAAAGREGLHRHPRRCAGGGRRRPRREVFCMEAMWTRFQPAVVHARELVAAGEIGELLLVQADLLRPARLRPDEPALRPRARRRLGPRPRRLPDLVRPAPPRPTRRRHGHRDDVRQRRRRVRRLPPVVRRRAGGVADQLARRRAAGPGDHRGHEGLDRAGAAVPPPDAGSSYAATGSRPRPSTARPPGAATPTRPSRCRTAWPPVAPRARSCPWPTPSTCSGCSRSRCASSGIEMPRRAWTWTRDGPEPAAGRVRWGHHGRRCARSAAG